MKRRYTTLKVTLMVCSALLFSLAAIVWCLPRETKFAYEYQLDKPWRYAGLIASYDFPIYKSDEVLEAERDSVMRGFQPYYRELPNAAREVESALKRDYAEGKMKDVPENYLRHVLDQLDDIYAAGVMSPADFSTISDQRSPNSIRVIDGLEAVSRPLDRFYSTRSAYERIMDADTTNYSREVLARIALNNYLKPSLVYDTAKTTVMLEDILSAVSPTTGMVQSGQKIIDRGEIVTPEKLQLLDSFRKETLERNDPTQGMAYVFGGQLLIVATLLMVMFFYLYLFRQDRLAQPNNLYLVFFLLTIFPVATARVSLFDPVAVYLIPYALVPILVRLFVDSRTAFMTLVITLLLSAISLHGSPEFLLMQTVAGVTAIYALKELTQRSQLLQTVFAIVAVTLVVDAAFHFAEGGDFASLDLTRMAYIGINGIFLLFAYPLMYLIERLFGFTSSVALVEMTNINNDLLRRMSKEAQGTFNHSMQVANMAAEVAIKIGANPQLARTGALYHDIGKLSNPTYFTENQNGINPHDTLTEERSAEIIISHVTEGVKLADKHNLPKVIKDFILTHHGRSRVKYFFIQYCNNHPGEEVDASRFTYPGPQPFTKEQAILMMCDAVEASSRSLKEYTEESIRELVNRIIDGQVGEGCFEHCPITFRDIRDAKRVLEESLKTIYHTRVAYPELKTNERPAAPQRMGLFGSGIYKTWNRRD